MEGYAYLGAGGFGKLKFPDEHAEWTRTLADQGYARIPAENASKGEKKSERERIKSRGKEAQTGRKLRATSDDKLSDLGDESQIGDGTGIQKETKKTLFGFLRRSPKDEKESIISYPATCGCTFSVV